MGAVVMPRPRVVLAFSAPLTNATAVQLFSVFPVVVFFENTGEDSEVFGWVGSCAEGIHPQFLLAAVSDAMSGGEVWGEAARASMWGMWGIRERGGWIGRRSGRAQAIDGSFQRPGTRAATQSWEFGRPGPTSASA